MSLITAVHDGIQIIKKIYIYNQLNVTRGEVYGFGRIRNCRRKLVEEEEEKTSAARLEDAILFSNCRVV